MTVSTASFTEPSAVFLGPAGIDPPRVRLPLGMARVALGFPSPADDFVDDTVDLNELLIRNPPATFFYRAAGWSMVDAGIFDGDLLVVDRSVEPRDGDVVIALWEGNAPACKVLCIHDDRIELESRNAAAPIPNIVLESGTEVEVFVVTNVVRQMRRGHARFAR